MKRAKEILQTHKDALGRVAERLLVQEVMSEEEFREEIEGASEERKEDVES